MRQAYHAMYVCEQRQVLQQTDQGRAHLTISENACTLHLSLPLSCTTLPQSFRESVSTPVILQIIKRHTFEGNSVKDVDSILIMPLQIVRCEAVAAP